MVRIGVLFLQSHLLLLKFQLSSLQCHRPLLLRKRRLFGRKLLLLLLLLAATLSANLFLRQH
jgi:hypothetical protein